MDNMAFDSIIQGLPGTLKFFAAAEMVITPHAQRERGKVIGVGVHYMFVDFSSNL